MEEEFIIFAFLTALTVVASLVITGFFTKRAVFKVVEILCRHDALGVKKAKTLNELGLNPPNPIKRIIRPRDYKPYALQILQRQGIVRMTKEGKLYLVETKMNENLKCKHNLFPKIEP
jgi:hypothetical protein